MNWITIAFQVQSILILALLYYGVYHRRNRAKHMMIMKVAIIWDLLLVLQIELSRGAIAKASKAMTNPWLLNFHVTIAVTTVLLYFVLGITGTQLNKGKNNLRPWHKKLGVLALTLRTLTLITSYLVN